MKRERELMPVLLLPIIPVAVVIGGGGREEADLLMVVTLAFSIVVSEKSFYTEVDSVVVRHLDKLRETGVCTQVMARALRLTKHLVQRVFPQHSSRLRSGNAVHPRFTEMAELVGRERGRGSIGRIAEMMECERWGEIG